MKTLPAGLNDYLNFGHLHPGIDFDRIVLDSREFSIAELRSIICDSLVDLQVRRTALFMVGSAWTKEAIYEIKSFLLENNELIEGIETLLQFYLDESALDLVNFLRSENYITASKAEFILSEINNNIMHKKDPIKRWGHAVFKSS